MKHDTLILSVVCRTELVRDDSMRKQADSNCTFTTANRDAGININSRVKVL